MATCEPDILAQLHGIKLIPLAGRNSKRTFGPVDLDEVYAPNGKKAAAAQDSPRTLARWQSDKTGLRIVHVDTPGPIVSLYAAVATEIFNDAGIPHTLEHATFLGRFSNLHHKQSKGI